MQGWRL